MGNWGITDMDTCKIVYFIVWTLIQSALKVSYRFTWGRQENWLNTIMFNYNIIIMITYASGECNY